MTIDTFLGIFGAATGVIGLFLAYYFYKRSIRTKVLAIAYTDPIPLMMTLGKMEVVYEGAAINALSRVYVLLWNRGTAPIEGSDFLSPVTISASAPILNLQIQDADAAASVRLDENARSVSINLLRPGEAVTLVAEVTSETYRPEIRVEMKSADMSTFISGFYSLYPSIAAFCVFILLLGAELAILNSLRDAFPASDPSLPYAPFKEDPGIIMFLATLLGVLLVTLAILAIIPFTIGAIVQRATKAFLDRTITPVAWRFFEFKVSAWTMRTRLKQFRKFIDAEYKKIAPT
jgi:hypothetical protein